MKRWMPVLIISVVVSACGEDNIASISGEGVSEEEFDAYLKYKRVAVRNDRHRRQVLEQYLEREALADVLAEKVLKDDPVIRAELADRRREILISRYFQNYLNKQVSDQAVRNYYDNHIDEYQEKKVHVAHILLRTRRNMDESERKTKLTTAQEAYSKIQAGGMDFAEAAERYSEDDVSAKKGGDLGWIKQGTIDSAFSEKAFSLKPGEISEPFQTPFGFHILKVLEEPKVMRRPFDAVKGEIRYQLRNEHKDAEMERLLSEIDIEINEISGKEGNQ